MVMASTAFKRPARHAGRAAAAAMTLMPRAGTNTSTIGTSGLGGGRLMASAAWSSSGLLAIAPSGTAIKQAASAGTSI